MLNSFARMFMGGTWDERVEQGLLGLRIVYVALANPAHDLADKL
tara:strand:+ start:89463 stop:89594 length:132 start_codon:yes stop_codon:yes gene_type:complete